MLFLKNFKRGILTVLASILVLSSVPIDVSAKTASQMTPSEQAKSWLYVQALATCIAKAELADRHWTRPVRISQSHAASGQWFGNPRTGAVNPAIGHFLQGKDLGTSGEVVGCGGSNIGWIADALQLWGYPEDTRLQENPGTNYFILALCDFGFKRDDGGDCFKSGANFEREADAANKFLASVTNKVYGGPLPTDLSDPAKYVFYRDVLLAGCVGNNSVQPAKGLDDLSYELTRINQDYSIDDTLTAVDYYYSSISKKRFDNIRIMVRGVLTATNGGSQTSVYGGANEVSMTCGEIMVNANRYAETYSFYMREADEEIQDEERRNFPDLGAGSGESSSSCGVEGGLGWIICPVMNTLAGMTDAMFSAITSSLETDIQLVDTESETYTAWGYMRNIANVAFVIVFIIIIFSQLTGAGVSNYGVKKMLPRIVIAAVLVNISFFITQIAVDLSNILGYSLNSLFSEFGSVIDQSTFTAEGTAGGGFAGNLVAAILIGGAAVVAILALSIPVIIAVVLALAMIFLLLIARTALIVLLVVVSPLAFVAYLLPNTESLFKKWLKLFSSLLILFPMIGLVFGASNMAAAIILGAADDNWLRLTALGVAALPLFAVPAMLQGALKATGSIGSRLAGWSQKRNQAIGRQVKDTSTLGTMQKLRQAQRARNRAVHQGRVGGVLGRVPGLRRTGDSLAAQGAAVTAKADEESVQAQMARDQAQQINAQGHLARINDPRSNNIERLASIRAIGEIGGMGDVRALAASSALGHVTAGQRQAMQAVIAKKTGPEGAPYLGGAQMGLIANGTFNEAVAHVQHMLSNNFNASSFLGMHDNAREALLATAQASPVGSPERAAIIRVRGQIAANPDLQARIGQDLEATLAAF